MLTFVPTILHSLVCVVSFGGADSAFVDHSLIEVSLSFHAKQGSLCHPWLMIGFWRVLTSLVVSIDGANVGVEPTRVRFVKLHWIQVDFLPCSCFSRNPFSVTRVRRTSSLHRRMSGWVVLARPSKA